MSRDSGRPDRSEKEEFVFDGNKLSVFLRRLIAKSNLRRLEIVAPQGRVALRVSLTIAIAVAGLCMVLAPMLTSAVVLVALLAQVRFRVVRNHPGIADQQK